MGLNEDNSKAVDKFIVQATAALSGKQRTTTLDDIETEIVKLWVSVQVLKKQISDLKRPSMADALDKVREGWT